MDEYRKTSTLYDDQGRKGKPTTLQIRSRKCEHYSLECCEVSREAVNLGLVKQVFVCVGNIPPDCVIRQDLAAGKTIQELYERKSRE